MHRSAPRSFRSTAMTPRRCCDAPMLQCTRRSAGIWAPKSIRQHLDRYSPRRLALANALGEAIRVGQMTVHYQPIVSLRERRLDGVEALARWEHPEYGTIQPDEFIPIAEMGDQIRDLSLYVLNESARQSQCMAACRLFHHRFDQPVHTSADGQGLCRRRPPHPANARRALASRSISRSPKARCSRIPRAPSKR